MNKLEVIRLTLASITRFPQSSLEAVTVQSETLLEQRHKYEKVKISLKNARKDYHWWLARKKHAEKEAVAEENKLRPLKGKVRALEETIDRLYRDYEVKYRLFEKWMPWMENEIAKARYNQGKQTQAIAIPGPGSLVIPPF